MFVFIGLDDVSEEDNEVIDDDDQVERVDVVSVDDQEETIELVSDETPVDPPVTIVESGQLIDGSDEGEVFQVPDGSAENASNLDNLEDPIGLRDVSINAGAGNDTLDQNGGELDGEDTRFFLVNSTIHARAGDDVIEAAVENSLLDGGDGNDTITAFGSFSGTITGGDGNDLLSASNSGATHLPVAPLTVDGGAGDDTLIGGGENTTLLGGEGDDLIIYRGFSTATTGDGGAGNDTLQVETFAFDPDGRDGLIDVTGGTGSDLFELNINGFYEATTVVDVAATVALESFRVTDFEPSTDQLQIEIDDPADGFTLANARLENGVSGEAQLILRYESDALPNREISIRLVTTSEVSWSDIEFVGQNIPTLQPLT